jgi:hypothetical protein
MLVMTDWPTPMTDDEIRALSNHAKVIHCTAVVRRLKELRVQQQAILEELVDILERTERYLERQWEKES